MNSFKASFPAFASLLVLAASAAQDLAAQGQSITTKLEGLMGLVGPLVAFLPQAGNLGSELATLKGSPESMEQAAEALVSDLAFSSEKAKAIIAAAFPLAESLVGILPQAEALAAAIKA